ncbi:ester cyclase [Nocardia mexicana]|uniref:Ketosteroid isomerase-like protein n=1 Tax=Nocardia mexicana TaxID=279262 RepID=A0A370H1S3_9NOCA|nr:ester cyclase [Nocardia mexicana]RDI49969.1 ketosteroid isomerase-like protein [Nocardia mexicana]
MTRDEMDALFDQHCAAEAAKDAAAAAATLTPDAEHDVVGDPQGVLRDRSAIIERYRGLFDALTEEKFVTLHRYYGDDFFVDDSQWSGRVPGTFVGIPGGNRPLTFRILHVCEVRDGKISRENVWLDFAAIMQQLAV